MVKGYPNHYEMKRNRLIKLQQTKGICECCGKPGKYIHHLDEDKGNHEMDNLTILCRHCHVILHAGRINSSTKYTRIYGMSLQEMANRFGGTVSRYGYMHKKGTLTEFLAQNLPVWAEVE